MAIDDGRISNQQREKFSNWINSRAPLIGKCSICGHRQWTLLDHFVDLPVYRGGNIVLGAGPHYPNIGIICGNCGNTQLINAVLAGIFIADNPKPNMDEEKFESVADKT
jgi:hypothetical protein